MKEELLTDHDRDVAAQRIGQFKSLKDDHSIGLLLISTVDAHNPDKLERFRETLRKFFVVELEIDFADFMEFVRTIVDFARYPENAEPFKRKIKSEVYNNRIAEKEIAWRDLEIVFQKEVLEVTISGYSAIPGKNGCLENLSFNPDSLPGQVVEGGAINYRKIERYKEVTAGQKLLVVLKSEKGKEGLNYYGQSIPSGEVSDYEINIKKGTEKNPIYSRNGVEIGFEVFAKIEGVLVIGKDQKGEPRSLEVVDELIIPGNLDYSVGDLDGSGAEKYFLIKVKVIGCILSGFKLISKKTVSAKEAVGAVIESLEKIGINHVSGGTNLVAKDILVVEKTHNSFLWSEKKVIVQTETIGSLIEAPDCCIKSSKETKVAVSGSTIIANRGTIAKGVFSGETLISLCKKLYDRKKEIPEEEVQKRLDWDSLKTQISEKMRQIILLLFKIKKDLAPDYSEKFDGLPNTFLQVCENLKGIPIANQIDIGKVEKALKSLKELIESRNELERELSELKIEQDWIKNEFLNIKFIVTGALRPGATIVLEFRNVRHTFWGESFERNGVLDLVFLYDNSSGKLDIQNKFPKIIKMKKEFIT